MASMPLQLPKSSIVTSDNTGISSTELRSQEGPGRDVHWNSKVRTPSLHRRPLPTLTVSNLLSAGNTIQELGATNCSCVIVLHRDFEISAEHPPTANMTLEFQGKPPCAPSGVYGKPSCPPCLSLYLACRVVDLRFVSPPVYNMKLASSAAPISSHL